MKDSKKNIKHFNFPIQLLQGFMKDKIAVLEDIRDYAIYILAKSYNSSDKIESGEKALLFFGIKVSNLESSLEIGKCFDQLYPKGNPMTGITVNVWQNYYKNNKTEFENICLLGFLALKSFLIGHQQYYKAVNNYWLARMDGKRCAVKNKSELSKEIFKYSTEYQTVKIKRALVDGWGLKTYGTGVYGFWVSFTKTLNEVVLKAEMNKKANIVILQKKAVEEAKRKALESINGTSLIE